MTEHSIAGKSVIIGGGAKNLGGLIARDMAKNGVRAIAIHYNSAATQAAAEETLAAVTDLGAEAYIVQSDLTSAAANTRLFDEAKERLGGIDIAVNTTGMVIKKPILDSTEED